MSHAVLEAEARTLIDRYPDEAQADQDEAWEESSFGWIRKKASATKGRIGRDLAIALLESSGYVPSRRGMCLEVNGKTIRVRLSLMWNAGAGDFKFEQFRDDNYDYVLCIGLYPDASYAWFIPKNELIDNGNMQERDGLARQHGGQAGLEDLWLTINTSNIPEWLISYGGHADGVGKVIQSFL